MTAERARLRHTLKSPPSQTPTRLLTNSSRPFAGRQRRHEIGVRKVVGASAEQIVGLLSKDFLKLVGLAITAVVPVAYGALTCWLDTFAYHFELGPGLFLLASGGALFLALVTGSAQAVRDARIDPATVLRHE